MAREFDHEVNSRPRDRQTLRFGVFDLDLENQELRRRGLRVKLQQKPFQILRLLISQAGKFVTRAQLAGYLWPNLHVNFDRSLNTAMNSLRRALGDSPENPRFIETRTGLGYRFIAPVATAADDSVDQTLRESEQAYTGNLDAYHDYLKGRFFQDKMTEEDLGKSVAYFEAALAADRGCAPAYAGLADTYSMLAFFGVLSAKDAHARAMEFGAAALRIDPQLAEAHAALAGIRKLDDWDCAGAESAYQKAIQLKPDYAQGRRMYAVLLSSLGRHEEALREIQQARKLDPLSLVINADVAWVQYMARDFQGAVEQAWRTLAMEPKFAPAQHALGLAYQQLGMLEEAIVEFRNARICSLDQPAMIASLGYAYALAGDRSQAHELLRQLEHRSRDRHLSPYWIALIHAGEGDTGRVLQSIKRAFDDRDVLLPWFEVEPRFDSARNDARPPEMARFNRTGAYAAV